jgi:2-polyprenyl-3-methyl-5-hydroxy-6-metoxy-1,4-benzoquinol methylase
MGRGRLTMMQTSNNGTVPSLSLRARTARAVRRLLGVDRERRWNREYAAGSWDWLARLDEMAHHAVVAGYVAHMKAGGTVLDMGCGEGLLLDHLRGAAGGYLGVDFREAVARAMVRRGTDGVRFLAADMNDFTTEERFDVVVFNESIYYLADGVQGLIRYDRFLKPGGVLLLSMHGHPRNDRLWVQVEEFYTVVDGVTITNKAGTTWRVKALVPRVEGRTP